MNKTLLTALQHIILGLLINSVKNIIVIENAVVDGEK